MPNRYLSSLLLALTLAFTTTTFAASHEKILHVFNGTPVRFPSSGLIADPFGNLYGVAQGAVYELSPNSSGGYTYQLLSTLLAGSNDFASGNLVRDNAGNLYGSTHQGGANTCGYVYELSHGAPWTLTVLHHFTCSDGAGAGFTMALDSSGNLFGATDHGGVFGEGVAYELSPGAGGSWNYQVIHDFSTPEGNGPLTGLILDSGGNLYGGNQTSIFKLTPGTGGTWMESAAYIFHAPTDGSGPHGDLIFDSAGNLYGTTSSSGVNSAGTAFELSPASGGTWTFALLHSFSVSLSDGSTPFGGLVRDAAGNLYGTTQLGGTAANLGTVYKLSFFNGVWHASILYRFTGTASNDGANPVGSLYLNSNTLFGATEAGGVANTCNNGNGCGTVFAIR